MEQSEILRLKNRRQYIVSPRQIEFSSYFVERKLTENCFLYSHIDLNVTQFQNGKVSLTLLGEIFDYESPKKGNKDILKDLSSENLKLFYERLSEYAGRYVIIRISEGQIFFFHDAMASRKVYYTSTKNGNWCCSRPQMLAGILHINISKNQSIQRYLESNGYKGLNNANIGNLTTYENIFQLMPNHYLKFHELSAVRYWPDKTIQLLPFKEVAAKCAAMIKGYMAAFNERFDLMVPLTGGKDSRVIMAATKEFRDEVYYYVNKEKRLKDNSTDITIPNKMAKNLGFDFHVLDPFNTTIDKDFEKVYYENNPSASSRYFPIIHNYFTYFGHKVNVPGVFAAAGTDMYGTYYKNISPFTIARSNRVEDFDFAVQYYSRWLNKNLKICREANVSIFTLLYWEERVGNWGSQIQLEKDIAQEDLTPYNSRKLIEYTYSIDQKYNNQPDFLLHKEILKILWPETLKFQINPEFRRYTKYIIHFLRIFHLLFTLRFIVTNWWCRIKGQKNKKLNTSTNYKLEPDRFEMAKAI